MAAYRRIILNEIDGVSIVKFVDKKIVDAGTIEQLGEELSHMVDTDKKNMILLNFDGVEFMGSAALNKFISLNKKVKAAAGVLRLCSLRPEIEEVFKITKLNKV